MSNSLYSQENIEAYLSKKLSPSQEKMFEQGLTKDPLLHHEVKLQSDIIEALKETRRQQLKTRLNNIDVSTVTYFPYKIASSIVIGLTLIGSLYLYNTTDETHHATVKEAKQVSHKPTVQQNQPVFINPRVEKTVAANQFESQSGNASEKSEVKDSKNKPATSILDLNPEQEIIASAKEPEAKSSFKEEEIHAEHTITLPQGEISDHSEELTSDVQVSIQSPQDSNGFSYQFYNNKLFLFCNFDSKPYELIEYNKKQTKQLYLHFNNSYYELKNNQIEPTPLKVLDNKELVRQLEIMKHR